MNGDGAGNAVDHITDFKVGTFNEGTTGSAAPDRLDLSKLLVGETGANIGNYLSIYQNGGNAEIRISTTGGFAAGVYSPAAHDGGTIVLDGVNLSSTTLSQLLSSGQLVIG